MIASLGFRGVYGSADYGLSCIADLVTDHSFGFRQAPTTLAPFTFHSFLYKPKDGYGVRLTVKNRFAKVGIVRKLDRLEDQGESLLVVNCLPIL